MCFLHIISFHRQHSCERVTLSFWDHRDQGIFSELHSWHRAEPRTTLTEFTVLTTNRTHTDYCTLSSESLTSIFYYVIVFLKSQSYLVPILLLPLLSSHLVPKSTGQHLWLSDALGIEKLRSEVEQRYGTVMRGGVSSVLRKRAYYSCSLGADKDGSLKGDMTKSRWSKEKTLGYACMDSRVKRKDWLLMGRGSCHPCDHRQDSIMCCRKTGEISRGVSSMLGWWGDVSLMNSVFSMKEKLSWGETWGMKVQWEKRQEGEYWNWDGSRRWLPAGGEPDSRSAHSSVSSSNALLRTQTQGGHTVKPSSAGDLQGQPQAKEPGVVLMTCAP